MSLNRHLFSATDTDSGALNVLGTVVHQFEDTGEYRIDLFRGDRYVTHRYLVVDDEEPRTQVTLDAATLPEVQDRESHERSCCCGDHDVFHLRENGHFVLDVSRGPGGFAVRVTAADDGDPVFDSRELDENDHFAATLMRPGRYVARQREGDAELTVTVPYPTGEGRGVPEPERIDVTEDGFEASDVEIRTGQGLVFDVDTGARIEIELEEPDDGDGDGGESAGGRHEPGPGQSAGSDRVDPAEFDADAVQRELEKITSKTELQALKQREAQEKNRQAVIDAVEHRLAAIDEEASEE